MNYEVVRIGPSGGAKVLAVMADRGLALRLRDHLIAQGPAKTRAMETFAVRTPDDERWVEWGNDDE